MKTGLIILFFVETRKKELYVVLDNNLKKKISQFDQITKIMITYVILISNLGTYIINFSFT